MLTITITARGRTITARPDTVRSLEGFVAHLYNQHYSTPPETRCYLDRLEKVSEGEYLAHLYRIGYVWLGLGVAGRKVRDYETPVQVTIQQGAGGGHGIR